MKHCRTNMGRSLTYDKLQVGDKVSFHIWPKPFYICPRFDLNMNYINQCWITENNIPITGEVHSIDKVNEGFIFIKLDCEESILEISDNVIPEMTKNYWEL